MIICFIYYEQLQQNFCPQIAYYTHLKTHFKIVNLSQIIWRSRAEWAGQSLTQNGARWLAAREWRRARGASSRILERNKELTALLEMKRKTTSSWFFTGREFESENGVRKSFVRLDLQPAGHHPHWFIVQNLYARNQVPKSRRRRSRAIPERWIQELASFCTDIRYPRLPVSRAREIDRI